MAISTISNGDSGLSARNSLNEIITYLNGLGLDIEFSDDNISWHYPWVSGDLYMRLSNDYGTTWTDGIYLSYSESGASGWDSVVFDTGNGNLNFYKGAVLDFTESLEGRYALSSATAQTVFSITLPTSTTVAGRIAAAVSGTDYPAGWTLAAGGSPIDIDITHGLGRRVAYVSVFAVTGTEEQQLFNTAAYNGIITTTTSILRIQSLATIQKEIRIYIIFE